jgi:hypothetical protein
MKTFFTIPVLLTIAITGIVSCRLFEQENYDLSALLTLASFASITLWITLLKEKKTIFQ